MLQAQQLERRFSFMESAKLVKTTGEPLRALQELEKSMRLLGLTEESSGTIDLTDDEESKKMKAKVRNSLPLYVPVTNISQAQVLRARWMNESDRYETNHILQAFQSATDLCPRCVIYSKRIFTYTEFGIPDGRVVITIWANTTTNVLRTYLFLTSSLGTEFTQLTFALSDLTLRGVRMNLYTVRFFARAIKSGSKYIYQTIPRLLTIWLDLGEDRNLSSGESFKKLNDTVAKAIKETPVYKVSVCSVAECYLISSSVVHGFPSNCISSGSQQHRSLQTFE